jgi:Leucine-rich repeat (LRR) protein
MMVTGAAHGFVVTFADANLELAVRTEINKPSGNLQNTDLVGVGFTSLRAASLHNQNLSGLEYCTDLTHLELYGNNISDISVLASLTKLRDIYLWNNQIVDITPLTDLVQLKYVFLYNNLIQDILPLFLNTGLGAGDIVNLSGNPLDR